MQERRRDAPVAAYSLFTEPLVPAVPSALTPSSLGYARDEHRSAWFRTQDSNLEFAVQSRASCQLDQSGSMPPEGFEPPTTGLKVRDDRHFTTEANGRKMAAAFHSNAHSSLRNEIRNEIRNEKSHRGLPGWLL